MQFHVLIEDQQYIYLDQSLNKTMSQRQSSDLNNLSDSRFLMRHSSSTTNLFPCCSSSELNQAETMHPEKSQPRKISIKNVLRASGFKDGKMNASISQCQYGKYDKDSSLNADSNTFIKRKISQFTQNSRQTRKNQHSSTATLKKREKSNEAFLVNPVERYEALENFIEKYIDEAKEVNASLVGEKEKKFKLSNNNHNFDIKRVKSNFKINVKPETPTNNHQSGNFQSVNYIQHKNEGQSNNCHFSFGQHQKDLFLNKFNGFRQVLSKRPSKESMNIQGEQDVESIQFAGETSRLMDELMKRAEKHNMRTYPPRNEEDEVIERFNFVKQKQERYQTVNFIQRGQI